MCFSRLLTGKHCAALCINWSLVVVHLFMCEVLLLTTVLLAYTASGFGLTYG